MTAKHLIEKYSLAPHPEGGFFAETYRSSELISRNGLPERFDGERSFSTAIYFLLEQGNFSAFHRIKSDECWHFYAGQTLLIYVIDQLGLLTITRLGNNPDTDKFQFVVPAGCWFASIPAPDTDFSFVGCTVAPGFDFQDFELASFKSLSTEYPQHRKIIEKLCLPNSQ